MIIDGNSIAAELYRETSNTVSHLDSRPHLTAFTCAPNFETKKFLTLKKELTKEMNWRFFQS